MNTRKLTVAVATTVLVVSVPLATVYAGAALAVGHHSARPPVAVSGLAEQAAATSRLSGLAEGGAALEEPPTAPPENAKAIANAERAARAAATSRLSGLAEGGAAVYS